jgi:hypothetical protein
MSASIKDFRIWFGSAPDCCAWRASRNQESTLLVALQATPVIIFGAPLPIACGMCPRADSHTMFEEMRFSGIGPGFVLRRSRIIDPYM